MKIVEVPKAIGITTQKGAICPSVLTQKSS